ncbi:MAG: MFS transporter [Xanthomonadales bacterium]|nr:MFS transporter [Xanthomonadales bacterium]
MSAGVQGLPGEALPRQPWWSVWVGARPGEWTALAWSFAYFFCLLCAYYLIRPMRDEMVVRFGADRMQWIYTVVFVIMLAITPVYGWLVSRWPRRRFLPFVYLFFIACLAGFWLLFRYNGALAGLAGADAAAFGRGSAAVLAIWITVFNLFVVSVFWSFMSDIYAPEQSRRLFATIATGGTLGAIVGPLLARTLAPLLGVERLLLLSGLLLSLCLVCIARLIPWARARERALQGLDRDTPIGGSLLAGATLVFQQPILRRMAALMLLGVVVGTILYNRQLHLQSANPDSLGRFVFFANLDLWINLLAITVQLGATRFLLPRFGAGWLLMAPGLALIVCFAVIYGNPVVMTVAIAQLVSRGLLFGMLSPARETLYTRVDREARYKAKNFIDTAVWRGGDLATQWGIVVLAAVGLATPGFALVGIGAAICWVAVAWAIRRWERGREGLERAAAASGPGTTPGRTGER